MPHSVLLPVVENLEFRVSLPRNRKGLGDLSGRLMIEEYLFPEKPLSTGDNAVWAASSKYTLPPLVPATLLNVPARLSFILPRKCVGLPSGVT